MDDFRDEEAADAAASPQTEASSAFSRYKIHTEKLVAMGFPMERAQRVLFRAVQQGSDPAEQLDVALTLLLEHGEEFEDEDGAVRGSGPRRWFSTSVT